MRWRVRRPLYTRRDAAIGAAWGALVGLAAGLATGALRPDVGFGAGAAMGTICGAAVGAVLAPIALSCIGGLVGYVATAKLLAGVVEPEVGAVMGGAFTLLVVIALGIRALERPPVRTYPGLSERTITFHDDQEEPAQRPARHALFGLIPVGERRERDVRIRLSGADWAGGVVGRTCPFCLSPIKPDEETRACPDCGTIHHGECWHENGGCTVYGCASGPGR